MSHTEARSGSIVVARILAALALAAVIVAVIVIVSGSGGDTASGGRGSHHGKARKSKDNPKTYVVKQGDTVAAISSRFRVSVPELLSLNPDLDPVTINAGQTIKLR